MSAYFAEGAPGDGRFDRSAFVRHRHARHDLLRKHRRGFHARCRHGGRLLGSAVTGVRFRTSRVRRDAALERHPVFLVRLAPTAPVPQSGDQADRSRPSHGYRLGLRAHAPATMSRLMARLPLVRPVCALVGLAVRWPPTCTTACCTIRPTPASATSARRSAARRSMRSRFGTFLRRAGGDLRRHLVRLRGALLSAGLADGAARGPRERAGLSVRRIDAGARRDPLSRLRVVRDLLKLVCVLCLITYAAVIGLFLVSGAATSLPMMSLASSRCSGSESAARQPAGARAGACCWLGGIGVDARVLPARGGSCDAAGSAPAADARISGRSSSASWRRAPRVPLAIPSEGAKVLIVKFADYQCPACGQAYLAYKPILAKYAASNPGAVRMVMKDYPLNADCNADVQHDAASGGLRRGGRRAAGAAHNKGDELEDWLLHAPAGDDAGVGPPGRARHRQRHRLRREVRGDARAREGRHRARHSS